MNIHNITVSKNILVKYEFIIRKAICAYIIYKLNSIINQRSQSYSLIFHELPDYGGLERSLRSFL